MLSREAREIAAWLRRVHGDTAVAFCRRMIQHFGKENIRVVPEWESVLSILEAGAAEEYQNMAPAKMNGHDRNAPRFYYFPEEARQNR
jgi:hypothetical protein